jgi:glutamyl-tRNA reductase
VAAQAPALLTIANRTLGRADAAGGELRRRISRAREAVARLAEFDIVVSCTASPLPLVGLGAVESAIKARRRRPMLMVDLAVPRDIEPEVARIEDVYLYTVDDLARIVQSGADKRSAAVEQAETIIESGVHDFLRWLETRRSVPLIQALQGAAEGWRATELQRARKSLAKGEDVDVVLESLSRGLTQRMLHGPMAGLQAAEEAERPALAHALARLYLQCPMRGRR